ncbi:type 1 glutamine amidotransferase domain-containing protein [Kytococcus sedentarius]|uniref:type 1 glutamine amidotransferase domain-containing protein n=1 Tax=Kytococcus sedentarius TaxID=1276 RepID=UPI0035BBAB22
MTSVLMVLSAARQLTLSDGSGHPAGVWAEEFISPHEVFTDAGWEVALATPGGAPAVIDEASLGKAGGLFPRTQGFFDAVERLSPLLRAPENLHALNLAAYDLVFYAGGYGPMEDLARDATAGAMLADRVASGRVVALSCHGAAAILPAAEAMDISPFRGRVMTAFSNSEERLTRFAHSMPWMLEDRLRAVGVDYRRAILPFRPHVVVDRNVYSGQNPQSSGHLARRLVADLGARRTAPVGTRR